jgi:hypothetical protein
MGEWVTENGKRVYKSTFYEPKNKDNPKTNIGSLRNPAKQENTYKKLPRIPEVKSRLNIQQKNDCSQQLTRILSHIPISRKKKC